MIRAMIYLREANMHKALIAAWLTIGAAWAGENARFSSQGKGYTVEVTKGLITMRFGNGIPLRMNVGAAEPERVLPEDNWRIRYRAVFPGIDLVIYRKGEDIEYDWVVAAGADPSLIQFSFSGASSLCVDENGDLAIFTTAGEVRHRKPLIYQKQGNGGRVEVDGAYTIASGGAAVGFRVGPYDKRKALVIDPTIVLLAGFGGSGYENNVIYVTREDDTASGIGSDRKGNIYVAGMSASRDFPLVNALEPPPDQSCRPPSYCGFHAGFVTKLSPDGKSVLYSTLIKSPPPVSWTLGSLSNIAVDADGNAYLTGSAYRASAGPSEIVIMKFASDGKLLASILLGGSGSDQGTSIALGPDGGLYIAGTTESSDFPVSAGAYRAKLPTANSIFVLKLNPALLSGNQLPAGALLYSTCLGPGDSPVVAADVAGNAYVTTGTTFTAWTTTAFAFQPTCAGSSCSDAVVVKLNPSGTAVLFATYFGGSAREKPVTIAIGPGGDVYIAGTTASSDLPVTAEAIDAKGPGPIFVAKLSSDGRRLMYSTYFGGHAASSTFPSGIAVDAAGRAYIAGYSYWFRYHSFEPSFPVVKAIQSTTYFETCYSYTSSSHPDSSATCGKAGFVSVLDPDGKKLEWSTYLGRDAVTAISLDAAGNLYAVGSGLSSGSISPIAPSTTAEVQVVKITPEGDHVQWEGLTNAASWNPGLPSPGGLASLFLRGLDLPASVTASGTPLPTELAGVSILIRGTPAPILSVSNVPDGMQQVNFQVPFEIGSVPGIEVSYRGATTFAYPRPVAPGIFTLPDGSPAIQHASDYSLVTPANPAAPGETIIVYGTGFGLVNPAIASGTPAPGPASASLARGVCEGVSGGKILYSGISPGHVGLYQLNVQLLPNLASGLVNFAYGTQPCQLGYTSFFDSNATNSNVVKLAVK